MIHREISRVLVLHHLWLTTRCSKHCTEQLCLDNAFALIEGHPQNLKLNSGMELLAVDQPSAVIRRKTQRKKGGPPAPGAANQSVYECATK